MSSQMASHGRGGAGNMAKSSDSPKLTASDLQTPTLKTPVVTTGRGGQGNMAKNKDPIETRNLQDVEAVLRRPSHGAQHGGRGGAGNILKGEKNESLRNQPANAIDDDSSSDGSKEKDGEKLEKVASKGKGWLFGKKA